MNLLFLVVGLFVVLSPGLLHTIPTWSLADVGGTQTTGLGVSYGGNYYCSTTHTGDVCVKATSLFTSGFTSPTAVLVHAVVFAAVLYVLPTYVNMGSLSTSSILTLTALFAALSPGLLLTLPAVSVADCATKGVHDGSDGNTLTGCTGTPVKATAPHCYACHEMWMSGFTSTPAVLVHGVVFGAVVYFLATRYL